jgi:N-acyl-D-aspartate/D-glutamate deacylase
VSDLLIVNGMLVDGTGGPPRPADVRIRAGKIQELGLNLAVVDEAVVDACGALVVPGFIDCHTHLDANVYWDPMCDPMALHGVTTAVIGNCSLGFAPVRAAMRAKLVDTFSYLEDIPAEAFESVVPWTWETFEDYANDLRSRPLGINVASFVGHSQIREYVIGPEAWTRSSTASERAQIASELELALRGGALGMSLSYFDRDRLGNPVPSQFADDAELDLLFAVLARFGASVQFVSSNTRRLQDVARMGAFAKRHGVVILHNTLVHKSDDPEHSNSLIRLLTSLQSDGVRAYSMVTPRPFEFAVNFDQSLCFIALPAWNELVQAKGTIKRGMLTDPQWRSRARHDFDTVEISPMFPVRKLHQIRVTEARPGDTAKWIGRSLKELVDARGGHPADVLADWLLENDFHTAFVNPSSNTDPAGVASLLRSPVAFVGASDAGAHLQMFSGAGDTTILLARHVRDRRDFTIERAVHDLTGRQADLLGLSDRGRLQVGNAGDVVIFNLADLRFEREEVVRDIPGGKPRFRRESGGYLFTIIAGQVVQQAGVPTGRLPATFLRLVRSGAAGAPIDAFRYD